MERRSAIKETGEKSKGAILRIQRMLTEDGPGIRSTVFFKGCPLHCVWCHNPEGISPKIQIHQVLTRCIGCRSCIEACAAGALTAGTAGIAIDREKCTNCLACVEICPSTAMEAYGETGELDTLVRELQKDRVYFKKSGGGVTLSGGEPLMQAAFAKDLCTALKHSGISTALDTCGQCTGDTFNDLLPLTDLVLYDVKVLDFKLHREFTGAGNERILENLVRLAKQVCERGMPKELWVRTPLIPGCTATGENIRAIGMFIKKNLGAAVSRWELCAFNNLCVDKYDGLGIDWRFREVSPMTRDDAWRLASIAQDSGVDAGIVHLSGPMKNVITGEPSAQVISDRGGAV